jgi:hypothetical protein
MNHNFGKVVDKYFKGDINLYIPFDGVSVENIFHKPTYINFIHVSKGSSTIRMPNEWRVQVVPNSQLAFSEKDLMRIILQLRSK